MREYRIQFDPMGATGLCREDRTLLDMARDLGIELVGICGGEGTCRQCRVSILDGELTPPTDNESEAFDRAELDSGHRLACQACPRSDVRVWVPPESLTSVQRLQVEGVRRAVTADPAVKTYRVQLEQPSLTDARADAERLAAGMRREHGVECARLDVSVLQRLSHDLRSWGWNVAVSVREGEVVSVARWDEPRLGLAVDLGTTKIAAYLVDLESGKVLVSRGLLNPQVDQGGDVITRLGRAIESPAMARGLQQAAMNAIGDLASQMCAQAGCGRASILDAVIVGNTAMHHLLLGLPVRQLAQAPYVPAVQGALDIRVRDLGLDFAGGAYAHFLPIVGGFVGGDHVSTLVAVGAADTGGTALVLDIGTNTEIALLCDGEIASGSCASGPAFEGGHIRHGMRAGIGAIDRVWWDGSRLEFQTIGGVSPVGLCGSGALDALAQLYSAGIVDKTGRMRDGTGVRMRDGEREYVIAEGDGDSSRGVVITQSDVRQLQLAKGAIRAGIRLLLATAGRSETDVERVIIAGAFGTYINIPSAVAIGMLPALSLSSFEQVGNAAGMGAVATLVSRVKRQEAAELARRIRYVELGNSPDFPSTFVKATLLGH